MNGKNVELVTTEDLAPDAEDDTQPQFSQDFEDELLQAREDGESAWRRVARASLAEIATGKPAMAVYARAGHIAGIAARTARAYCDLYRAVGDELLDEFMFTREGWEYMVAQVRKRLARGQRRDLQVVRQEVAADAVEWSKDDDKYGGMPIPVDVILGAGPRPQRTKRTPEQLLAAALERIERSCVSALRHTPLLTELEQAELRDWLAKAEAMRDRLDPDSADDDGVPEIDDEDEELGESFLDDDDLEEAVRDDAS